MAVYLVSIKTLKQDYNFDENLDDKYILNIIQKGQRFIINGILGDDKYNELLIQVSGNTVTTQNRYMIDNYIKDILAYYTLSEVQFATAYKIKNVGIEQASTDRYNELVKIANKYLKDSEQFQQLFEDWLCDNSVILDTEGRKQTIKTGLFLECSKKPKFNMNGSDEGWERD